MGRRADGLGPHPRNDRTAGYPLELWVIPSYTSREPTTGTDIRSSEVDREQAEPRESGQAVHDALTAIQTQKSPDRSL